MSIKTAKQAGTTNCVKQLYVTVPGLDCNIKSIGLSIDHQNVDSTFHHTGYHFLTMVFSGI